MNFGGSFTTTVPINIINDDNVEATESFRVSLSSTDSDVMIPSGMGTANVDILDVDSELELYSRYSTIVHCLPPYSSYDWVRTSYLQRQ